MATQTPTRDQQTALAQLRAELGAEKTFSDKILLRFLILTKLNVQNAATAARKFTKLWEEYKKPSNKGVAAELETSKYRIGGKDKHGRRIVHMYYAKHLPSDFSLATSMKTIFVLLGKLLEDPEVCENGATWVVWMEGSGWKNFDLESEKFFVSLYEDMKFIGDHLMSEMIMVDSPWYVSLMMKLMNPFLSEDVKRRLALITSGELSRRYERSALFAGDHLMAELKATEDFSRVWD